MPLTNKNVLIASILIALSMFSLIAFAQAPAASSPTHQFYGDVFINGAPAPGGTIVKAQINGVDVESTTVNSNGQYVLYIDDLNNVNTGRTIVFFVNNVQAATEAFCNGCLNSCGLNYDNCPEFDLSVTTSDGGTTGGAAGGGAGGGGGGGAGGATTTTTQNGTCREAWTCSDWGPCEDGLQRRTCSDQNACGTSNYEPFTVQPCSTATPAGVSEAAEGAAGTTTQAPLIDYRFITAFVTANPTGAAILGVAIIVLLYTGWRMWKRKNKSSTVNA